MAGTSAAQVLADGGSHAPRQQQGLHSDVQVRQTYLPAGGCGPVSCVQDHIHQTGTGKHTEHASYTEPPITDKP